MLAEWYVVQSGGQGACREHSGMPFGGRVSDDRRVVKFMVVLHPLSDFLESSDRK